MALTYPAQRPSEPALSLLASLNKATKYSYHSDLLMTLGPQVYQRDKFTYAGPISNLIPHMAPSATVSSGMISEETEHTPASGPLKFVSHLLYDMTTTPLRHFRSLFKCYFARAAFPGHRIVTLLPLPWLYFSLSLLFYYNFIWVIHLMSTGLNGMPSPLEAGPVSGHCWIQNSGWHRGVVQQTLTESMNHTLLDDGETEAQRFRNSPEVTQTKKKRKTNPGPESLFLMPPWGPATRVPGPLLPFTRAPSIPGFLTLLIQREETQR